MKKKVCLGLILTALLFAVACNNSPAENTAEPPVIIEGGVEIQWVDPALEALVRQVLNKPQGVIYQEELDYITRLELYGESYLFFNYEDGGLRKGLDFHYRDLDDMQKMPKDGTYDLNGQQYTRGSISSLADFANFRKLKELWLYKNSLKDLTGLVSLENLICLSLWDNEIQNASALSALRQLKYLDLSMNNIEEMTDFTGFDHIEYLGLAGNQISSLEFLSGFPSVFELSLGYTSLTNLEGLKNLESLERLKLLNLDGVQIDDVSVLAGNTSLTTLQLKYLKVDNFDLAQLTSIPNLDNLGLAQTQAEMLNVRSLAELKYLKYLSITNVPDEDITWLREQLPFCNI